MTPITPAEARRKKDLTIPSQVYEAFNELIVEHLGTNGYTFVKQIDVVNRILLKFKESGNPITIEDILNNRWLNIERLYEDVGWEVCYTCRQLIEGEVATARFIFSTTHKILKPLKSKMVRV